MTHAAYLSLNQPLDMDTTLNSGQAFRWQTDGKGSFNTVLGQNLVRLHRSAEGIYIESSPVPPQNLISFMADYFRLDDDLPQIQSTLSKDAHVAAGIASYPGLRLLRQDPWETLAAFILSSVSNIPRITRTIELIADSFGTPVKLNGLSRNTFPSPECIVDAGEESLRRLGCGYRAKYLVGAAALISDGVVPIGELRGLEYEEAEKILLSLPGVGRKVADCVMLFALDLLSAFPVDRWIYRVIQEYYPTGDKLNYNNARAIALDKFGIYAGYANHYLFWQRRNMVSA